MNLKFIQEPLTNPIRINPYQTIPDHIRPDHSKPYQAIPIQKHVPIHVLINVIITNNSLKKNGIKNNGRLTKNSQQIKFPNFSVYSLAFDSIPFNGHLLIFIIEPRNFSNLKIATSFRPKSRCMARFIYKMRSFFFWYSFVVFDMTIVIKCWLCKGL